MKRGLWNELRVAVIGRVLLGVLLALSSTAWAAQNPNTGTEIARDSRSVMQQPPARVASKQINSSLRLPTRRPTYVRARRLFPFVTLPRHSSRT